MWIVNKIKEPTMEIFSFWASRGKTDERGQKTHERRLNI